MNWPNVDRWDALLRAAGSSRPAPGWYDRLRSTYSEPQRYYHNQQHIAECLAEFDEAGHLAKEPAAVELALWFHDAVYDPRAGNNEEQSAVLATECLQEFEIAPPMIDRVAQLIMTTKSHEMGIDQDAKLMVDVDLSILGRDEKRFFEYEDQIQKEYAWVPTSVFASKRSEILKRFLDRSHVFATEWFRRKYEKPARRNLEASIVRLHHCER